MSGEFIQQLLDEEVIKLWHDYRTGHCRDLSGNGNHGTIVGNCIFEGFGLRLVGNTAYVEVAHDASLNFTDLTAVLLKPQQRNYALSSASHATYLLTKASGGAGTIWQIYLNANRVLINDGTVSRWSPLVYYDDERYVALSLAAGGATAIGYQNGLSVGNYSGANTLPTNTRDVRMGWPSVNTYDGTMESVMLLNRVLTEAEHAKLYADLVDLERSTSFYSHAEFEQSSFVGEPGLLAGFDLLPINGVVPSHDGLFSGTLSGEAMYRPGILGDGLAMGRTDGAVDLGVGNADIDPTTDSHWVEVWARPLDVPMSDANVPIIGKGVIGGYSHYNNFGIEHLATTFRVYWLNIALAYVNVVAVVVPRNRLTHLLCQVDRVTDNVHLYIDGVQYGPTAITTVFAAQATNWILGKSGSIHAGIDEGFGGLTVCPRIGTGVLTPAQVQARYLLGAQAIQFQTDGAYQISPAAEGGILHQQIGTRSSPFRAGDVNFRGVFEAEDVNGELNKVLTCTVAGKVYIPGHLFFDATPTEAAFGTFRGWMYKADLSDLTWKFIGTDLDAAANGYAFVWAADESVVISELGVGDVVAGGSASHSTWHRFDVTHAGDGDFDGYIDEITFGNGNDLTTTTSVGMLWSMGVGDKIALGNSADNDGIVKMLGVVAP